MMRMLNFIHLSMVLLLADLMASGRSGQPLTGFRDNYGMHVFNRDTVPGNDTVIAGKIYTKVDEEAAFPGGEGSWRSYIEQNIDPTVPGKNKAPEGVYTVLIQFVVDLDGKITNIRALTNYGYGMEAEVIRLLKKAPRWKPAMIQGKPVKAYRKQPVTFQVVSAKKIKSRNNP